MDALVGPPQLAVGYFRRLKHAVDARPFVASYRGIPLRFARCGAVSIPTMSPGPCPWCPRCWPEDR